MPNDNQHEVLVKSLYRLVLKRDADEQGLAHYSRKLRKGASPAAILTSLQSSDEYRRLAETDGQLQQSADNNKAFSDPNCADPVARILELSRTFFANRNFFATFKPVFPKQGTGRIQRIAVYYHRMHNGGTERVTALLINLWRQMGYDVTLLTDTPAEPDLDYDYGSDVPRFILPERMMHDHGYYERGIALAQILKRERIDLFVTNQWYEISTIWDVLVARSCGIPAIVAWHNSFDAGLHAVDDLKLCHLRFLGYRHANLLVTLSSVDRAFFREWQIPTRLIHNPLTFDLETLPASQLAERDKHLLVWVARVERHQKRVDLVLQMFALVLQRIPTARLRVIGDGPDRVWAQQLASGLGIRHCVEFIGYTSDVHRYVAGASLHVMTSEFEGYPMVLGEVWAHKIPTVLFDLPHLEMLRSKRGFVAVEQGDIHAMAEAVCALMQSESRRYKMGEDAYSVVKELQDTSIASDWQEVFETINRGEAFEVAPNEPNNTSSAQILAGMLSRKLLALSPHQTSATTTAHISVQRAAHSQAATALTNASKLLAIIAQNFLGALLGAISALKTSRGFFGPAKDERGSKKETRRRANRQRLQMIDLSQVGLGDNLMIWNGLFALLDNDTEVCAPGCAICVPPPLADLCEAFFKPFDLTVIPGRPQETLHPLFTPLPPDSWAEGFRALFGRDWRMTWVESLDLQKTIPRHGRATNTAAFRTWLFFSELIVHGRTSWRYTTPSYVGYRVWAPLAIKRGIYPVVFLAQMKRSFPKAQKLVRDYVDSLTPSEERHLYTGNAAFPVGKSFQTIPPAVYEKIMKAVNPAQFTCYVQNDSAWQTEYKQASVPTRHLDDISDALRVVRYADKLLTTDSFTSHAAQLLRDDFVLVLTRDLREQVVHPGSNPRIVANHPPCAPCNYQERFDFEHCLAGYRYCSAFSDPSFIDTIADALLTSRSNYAS